MSGFAGLVYEVLWMKQLGLLFGSTAQAAAATLACFFAGLSLGSWFWGKRSEKTRSGLRLYAGLQIAVALSAVLYFATFEIYHYIYPYIYQHIHSARLLLLVKVILAAGIVFPPAFFMGGTIPAIAQHAIAKREAFGATAARVYAWNTFGAALGAYMAGFHFPLWFGFRLSFLGAMGIGIIVAIMAFQYSRIIQKQTSKNKKETPQPDNAKLQSPPARNRTPHRWIILPLCFFSGFGFLALEVLWTRVFGQILENSVYTYSTILVIVLLCLTLGALISSFLAKTNVSPFYYLTILTLLGGIAIAATPSVVMALTNSLEVIAFKGSWGSYIGLIFRNGILIFGPAALLTGTIFPLLMKAEEQHAQSAGRSLGRMASINTIGSIAGALICGFVLLAYFGMWRSMQLLAAMYLIISLLIPHTWNKPNLVIKAIGVGTLILTCFVLFPEELPITSIDPLRGPENILESWEGKDCTVAVTEDDYGLAIKINSHYGLGSTASYMQARMQNHIPLMAYPETESIFFLGMGTGITAGGALDEMFPNVKEIVACELVPEVITAAQKYFTDYNGFDYTGGLFEDPRVTILTEDGRHYLMATDKQFDMINADLFVPFRIGDGSLYSLEHFLSVKDSLTPGGVFVQWLPLYMMTEFEFHVICRTMLEAFDQVSLWRANFQPIEEVVALVGHTPPFPIAKTDTDYSEDRALALQGKTYEDLQRLSLPLDPQSILFFYGGNITASTERFSEYPINSDDHPFVEYMAPRTYRKETDGPTPWFVGPRILRFIEEMQKNCPPSKDPLLAQLSNDAKQLPLAGSAFHRARIWETVGHPEEQRKAWNEFITHWRKSPAYQQAPDVMLRNQR